MLDPRDRSLLLECLRPPPGYELDRAMGTTFSLDLVALLTAPLAFTFFDWEDEDGRITADPLALLEAVRRHARRIRIFCQAGEIKVPAAAQRLTAWVEQSVVPVSAPRGGVFHPKLWLLRYVGTNLQPVRIRMLCLSRNLTFDHSWDTTLVLDGVVEERRNAIAQNHPLANFLAALPGLAVLGVDPSVVADVDLIAGEVRRVRWNLPELTTDLRFWPLGLSTSQQWPFKDLDAKRPMLVVSPFVQPAFLKKLNPGSRDVKLVSRPDTLAALPPELLASMKAVWTIDPATQDAEEDAEGDSDESGLCGLHAKIYVADDGWNGRVYLGSANATAAAFERNVEFLVELQGLRKDLGIAAVLGSSDQGIPGLLDIAKRWALTGPAPTAEQIALEQLEQQLDALKRQIATMTFHVTVDTQKDGTHGLRVHSEGSLPAKLGTGLVCWPAGLPRANQKPCAPGLPVDLQFGPVSTAAATAFVAFEISISGGGQSLRKSFVALARLHGAPADRYEQILATLLQDKDQLLRLLWLLLETAGAALPSAEDELQSGTPTFWGGTAPEGYPLFERIVRTLGTEPERLNDLGRILEDLSRTEKGQALVHPALKELWDALRPILKGSVA